MKTNPLENDPQTDTKNEKNEELTDLQPTEAQIEDIKGGPRDLLLDLR